LNKSRIILNAISAITQVVIVGIVYIILYKFVLTQIGVKLLGVWSLISATTSVVSIANFGISSSIVKFVSTYIARKRTDKIIKLVFTSLIFTITTYTLLSIIIYFLGTRLLNIIVEEDYVHIAITILPFSLISLVLGAMSGVFNSAIDGIQKNYIKNYIVISSSIILLFLSILLTPKFGILGLVYAQIFQSIFVFILSIFTFKKLFFLRLNFQWNWDTKLFKEILGYGVKVQLASILEMTFEPIAKFLLSKFGGLTILGYYEMASKLAVQLRSLIVSANQVIIPVIAETKENNPSSVNIIYLKIFPIVLYLDILLTTLIIVMAPVISLIWVGHYETIFVYILILSSISIFFNITSSPAYFNYMGEGKLNWILKSILISFLINILFGYFLGLNFGGLGVVIAFNIALILHAALLIGSFHKIKGIKIFDLISNYDLKLIICSIIFMIYSNHMFHSLLNGSSTSIQLVLHVISLTVFVFYIFKNHSFNVLKTLILTFILGIKGKNG
jgi:O-antigen/teichoic acid export membrane protein